MNDEARRVHMERALERGFPGAWRFEPAIPLDDFDAERSLAARPRLRGPEEFVARFAIDMEGGAVFPPIVAVGETRPNGLFILDGMIIYLAAREVGKSHHPAYVVAAEDLDPVLMHLHLNSWPPPDRPG